LRDVVADYGMDTGKLVLKWRDPERIVERIVEVARAAALRKAAPSATNPPAMEQPIPSSATTARKQKAEPGRKLWKKTGRIIMPVIPAAPLSISHGSPQLHVY
jgi:hypothetical protein